MKPKHAELREQKTVTYAQRKTTKLTSKKSYNLEFKKIHGVFITGFIQIYAGMTLLTRPPNITFTHKAVL
jgi:hypothetical protein